MRVIIDVLDFLHPYGHYAYLVMFVILLACGFGLPLPEDAVLIPGGMLASQNVTEFWMTVFVCMMGVLIGDSIIFWIGRKGGPKIKNTKMFKRLVQGKREQKVSEWFANYGDKVIFFARFLPGLRMPLFLTAGIYQVAYWKFLLLDGVAALISVPLWVWVGFVFGSNLEMLEKTINQFKYGLYGVLAIVITLIVTYILLKRRLNNRS